LCIAIECKHKDRPPAVALNLPKEKTEHATQIYSFTKGKPNISKCKKEVFFNTTKTQNNHKCCNDLFSPHSLAVFEGGKMK